VSYGHDIINISQGMVTMSGFAFRRFISISLSIILPSFKLFVQVHTIKCWWSGQ